MKNCLETVRKCPNKHSLTTNKTHTQTGTQFWQNELPVVFAYWPLLHTVHVVALIFALKKPAAHDTHALWPFAAAQTQR